MVITDAAVPLWNKLRVVALYALRYQKTQTGNIASLINLMLENGVSREHARVCPYSDINISFAQLIVSQLVYVVLNMAGADQRQDDLFSTESLLAKGRSALKGLKVFVSNQTRCFAHRDVLSRASRTYIHNIRLI
jgi:hypothetical protein